MEIRERVFRIHELEGTPEELAAFRVSFFGGSGEKAVEERLAMEQAKILAGIEVHNGFSIATGGYNVGVMKAASEGAIAKARELGRPVEKFVKA